MALHIQYILTNNYFGFIPNVICIGERILMMASNSDLFLVVYNLQVTSNIQILPNHFFNFLTLSNLIPIFLIYLKK